MKTLIEGRDPIDYAIDLSSINVFDGNGQIWVPDESMVDILVASSDPDILNVEVGGANGRIVVGAPGLATLEFTVWYEGDLVAVKTQSFLVVEESVEQRSVQDLGVKLQI